MTNLRRHIMEKLSGTCQDEDQMNLPPGFRFHPTDEELITHYLFNKVMDYTFFTKAIGEVDLNKIEPWELPRVATIDEKEWYFFCVRDKKYPTGLRTNRATIAGYWKATGKDKEIFTGRLLIGMKKTLVFYTGRAPNGEKTNWVVHEYRLDGKFSQQNLPKSAKTEWVICRVFQKNSWDKKVHFSGLMRADSGGVATSLPPLTGSPATFINQSEAKSNHVHCFSNPIENRTIQKNMNNNLSNFLKNPIFPIEGQSNPITHQFPSGSIFPMCDHAILSGLIGTYGHGLKMETKMVTGSHDVGVSSEKNTEISSKFEKGNKGIKDQEAPSTSVGPVRLDCLWNY